MEKQYIKKEHAESELTSKLIGFAYEVFHELGYGLSERIYQRAFEKLLTQNSIRFQREKYGKITFKGAIIGKYYLDFLINDKVAIEFKVRNDIYQKDIIQLLNYLKSESLSVGLIIAITTNGIKVKRLAN